MTSKGLEKEEAYEVALSEFYRLKEMADIQNRVYLQEALFYVDKSLPKTAVEIGLELEAQALESSIQAIKTREEM